MTHWSKGCSFETPDRHGRMISVVQSVRRLTQFCYAVDYRTSIGTTRDYIRCSEILPGINYRKSWLVHGRMGIDSFPDSFHGTLTSALETSRLALCERVLTGGLHKPLLQVVWVPFHGKSSCFLDHYLIGIVAPCRESRNVDRCSGTLLLGNLGHTDRGHLFNTEAEAKEWVVAKWMHLVIGEPDPVLPELKRGS